MALLKCKECGADVSDKAKKCPSCGAPAPKKKTSLFTWLVLLVIVVAAFNLTQSPKMEAPKKSSEEVAKEKAERLREIEERLNPSWTVSSSVDEMTGKASYYAHSPTGYPTKPLSFPYRGVTSWVGFGCDRSSEWAYFGFDKHPNIINTTYKNGYRQISARVRWDQNLSPIKLSQTTGDKFLSAINDSAMIKNLLLASEALLELSWHGNGQVVFRYSLKGSTKAVKDARARCKTL